MANKAPKITVAIAHYSPYSESAKSTVEGGVDDDTPHIECDITAFSMTKINAKRPSFVNAESAFTEYHLLVFDDE